MVQATPPEQQPIHVDPAASVAMILTGMRQFALILAGASTLIGFMHARDLVGLIAWIQSNAAVTLVTAAVTLASLIYGQYHTFIQKRDSVTMANASPNSVAIVRANWLTMRLLRFASLVKRATGITPSADGK